MESAALKAGDWVVYHKQKVSASPGPRAEDVVPASHGEDYTYTVQKYWVVQEVLEDGRLRLCTRRGKQHVVSPNDPRLRRPRWWERWLLAARFPAIQQQDSAPRADPVG